MSDSNDIFEEIKKAIEEKVGITIDIKRDDDVGFSVNFSTDEGPDIDEMSKEELLKYREVLEEKIDELDAKEPDDDTSEHEEWEIMHEELEDQLDDVEDRLDELS